MTIRLQYVSRTTLEQFRAPMFADNVSDPSGWSLGKLNNLREVFGKMKIVNSMSQSMLSEVHFQCIHLFSIHIIIHLGHCRRRILVDVAAANQELPW